MKQHDVIVIGAGAAGMMAAIQAARQGADVLLFERNEKPGRKLYITGKGRCNVTNDCTPDEVLAHVPHNGRFLFGAVHSFSPGDAMDFFRALGVPLKTERGNRVFPQSDHAADIIDALVRGLRKEKVTVHHDRVTSIRTEEGKVCGVESDWSFFSC